MNRLRDLPSIDELLQQSPPDWLEEFGRPLVKDALRSSLDDLREELKSAPSQFSIESILLSARRWLVLSTTSGLQTVINASGVILHTNLGRAPLSRQASLAMLRVAEGYSTLEYSLETGARGSRGGTLEKLLTRLTGAQAALVVNNNAAALLLCLAGLARGKRVVISRTQLVEIGGGFRIPEVMAASGARMLEIGTTNRVHLADYQQALESNPCLVVRAHQSNFRIIGFTAEPEFSEVCQAAHQRGVPVLDDLGSGVLLDTTRFGLPAEPTVQQSLQAGADLVCFSGDKLFGGPQAGIILGQADLIAKLRKHPLARAFRADKTCLAALEQTAIHYLKDEAERQIPVWQMISMPLDAIRVRAESWRSTLGQGEVIGGRSTIGGGSLPEETLPTWLLALSPPSLKKAQEALRIADPPVIARVEDGKLLFDPRTVLPGQDEPLCRALLSLLSPTPMRKP